MQRVLMHRILVRSVLRVLSSGQDGKTRHQPAIGLDAVVLPFTDWFRVLGDTKLRRACIGSRCCVVVRILLLREALHWNVVCGT